MISKKIQEIYIMDKRSGVLLFSTKNDGIKVSEDLISGFISGLNIYAQEFWNNELNNIKMQKFEFIIATIGDIIIVFRVDSGSSNKHLEKMIQDLGEEFNSRYQELLASKWDGNINIFKEFKIDNIMMKNFQKLHVNSIN